MQATSKNFHNSYRFRGEYFDHFSIYHHFPRKIEIFFITQNYNYNFHLFRKMLTRGLLIRTPKQRADSSCNQDYNSARISKRCHMILFSV